MDWTTIKPLLDAKLDPAHVRKPEGRYGPKGDWIEGWHAIAEANRIFGHGAWSYEIKSLDRDLLEQVTTAKGEQQWAAAYTCVVRLDVAGTVREDVGFGSGFAKQPGDAIEGATKEAVTDALKRALRTFGWPFGLALYDKQRGHVGVDAPPPDPAETRDRIKAALEKSDTPEALNRVWQHPATTDAIGGLPKPMQNELRNLERTRRKALTDTQPEPAQTAPNAAEAARLMMEGFTDVPAQHRATCTDIIADLMDGAPVDATKSFYGEALAKMEREAPDFHKALMADMDDYAPEKAE